MYVMDLCRAGTHRHGRMNMHRHRQHALHTHTKHTVITVISGTCTWVSHRVCEDKPRTCRHMHRGAHAHTRMHTLCTPRLAHSTLCSPCTTVATHCPAWQGPSAPHPHTLLALCLSLRHPWSRPSWTSQAAPSPSPRAGHRGPLWALARAALRKPVVCHMSRRDASPSPGPCEGGRAPVLLFPCEETDSGTS